MRLSAPIGGKELILEFGKVAGQASGAVIARGGDTVVLVTATVGKEPIEGADFLPLTVQYQEKTFAAGKIPGGFFKREGRPSDRETLVSRLIDRAIRPLFPKIFRNEIQVIATVLSSDGENDPATLSITAASAALMVSDIPFDGPIAGVRVGRIDGVFKANPTSDEMEKSDVDLIIAGSRDFVVMVEGGAKEVLEKDVVEAIRFAHESMQPLISIQDELREKCGVPKMEVPAKLLEDEFVSSINEFAIEKVRQALTIKEKLKRYEAFDSIIKEAVEKFTTEETKDKLKPHIAEIISELKRKEARKMILEKGVRIDGRGLKDIRDIHVEVSLLPRTHGSALFTRGETQVLAVTTLGTSEDQQLIDDISGEYEKRFMLHYNFPPFSVGEVRPLRGPSRREIGHGALAERALENLIPPEEKFPYTVRVVSEVLSSNGSSSMATVCSSSMSLMDAGVPIKTHVAGIAMGLIKEGERYAILSDILGDEDHLGDMDFKVAGTRDGITALQMDIKIRGISSEILYEAIEQARQGRLAIIEKMSECIPAPRDDISIYAPRIFFMKIDTNRIGDLIGSGGKTINKIISETGAKVSVDDDGSVQIAAAEKEALEKAIRMAKSVTSSPQVGKYYKGTVVKTTDFGAFVRILPGIDGLVHISELAHRRIKNVTDVVREGDEIVVKVLEYDKESGKVKLSKKSAEGHENEVEDIIFF